VQDEGSQVAALLADARPGMNVVDFCAGAGGKSLALAAAMRNKGKIVASDVLPGRVRRAGERLRRAGAHNVQTRELSSERDPWVKRHARSFDRVFIDAPCSGSGTWRRNPDAKWRFTPEQLATLADLQRRILASASRLVQPGGRLIYVTCSLLAAENVDQVRWFLEQEPSFAVLPIERVWAEAIGGTAPMSGDHLFLTPHRHGTDAFFVCVLERAPGPKNLLLGGEGGRAKRGRMRGGPATAAMLPARVQAMPSARGRYAGAGASPHPALSPKERVLLVGQR
jgi:16S rRNA (cytosine967-C5)-methyltransferase